MASYRRIRAIPYTLHPTLYTPLPMTTSLPTLLNLYRQRGQAQYGGEAVSQLEHALQCAALAEQAGQSAEMITACLFHDLGHLIHHLGEEPAARSIDDRHEYRAVPVLEKHFPAAVTRGRIRLCHGGEVLSGSAFGVFGIFLQ